jgi:WLM domain
MICCLILLVRLVDDVQVGVSDVCVMGLNENHGQTIRLRLRTDDLQGFRKPLSIKKVHLIHIVHIYALLTRHYQYALRDLQWQ